MRTKGRHTDRTISWTIPLLITFPGASLISVIWIFSYTFTREHIPLANRTFLIGA